MNPLSPTQRLSRWSSRFRDWANGSRRDAPVEVFRGRRVHPTQSSATATSARCCKWMSGRARRRPSKQMGALSHVCVYRYLGCQMRKDKDNPNQKGRALKPCPIRIAIRGGARVPRQDCPILPADKTDYIRTKPPNKPGRQISFLPLDKSLSWMSPKLGGSRDEFWCIGPCRL